MQESELFFVRVHGVLGATEALRSLWNGECKPGDFPVPSAPFQFSVLRTAFCFGDLLPPQSCPVLVSVWVSWRCLLSFRGMKRKERSRRRNSCVYFSGGGGWVVNICIFKKSPLLFSSVLHNTNCKQGRVPMLKVISIKIPRAFQGRQRNQPQAVVLGSAQLTLIASRGTSNFTVNYPGSHPWLSQAINKAMAALCTEKKVRWWFVWKSW